MVWLEMSYNRVLLESVTGRKYEHDPINDIYVLESEEDEYEFDETSSSLFDWD